MRKLRESTVAAVHRGKRWLIEKGWIKPIRWLPRKETKRAADFWDSLEKRSIGGEQGRGFEIARTRPGFEVQQGIGIFSEGTPGTIMNVGFGFKGRTIIMIPQGKKPDINEPRKVRQLLGRFQTATGKYPANYLVEAIEEHARRHGFKTAKIPIPESLYHYQNPYAKPEEIPKIQERMRKMYAAIASAMGYRERGLYYVKKL